MILQDKKNHSQKGIALITVMLIMATMSVLAVTMFNTSTVESLISSNYRTSKEAFYDADAGVQYGLARINQDLKNTDIDDIEPANYSPPSGNNGDEFNFSLSPLTKSGNTYYFTSTGKGSNNARAEIEASFEVSSSTHSAFKAGILSDGDIRFTGNSVIVGDVHSNGSLDVKLDTKEDNSGHFSAVDDFDIGIKDKDMYKYPLITIPDENEVVEDVYVPSVPDPPWTQKDIDRWIEEGKKIVKYSLDNEGSPLKENLNPNPGKQVENDDFFDYKGAGKHDQFESSGQTIQDTIILLDRDVIIDNKTTLKNATIISKGDVTFRGSSNNDNDINKNAIIALGDIDFSGSSSSYAVFWCNGDFDMSGSSDVIGSIVAGGSIGRSGSSNFEFDDNIENNDLAKEYSAVFASWKDASLY